MRSAMKEDRLAELSRSGPVFARSLGYGASWGMLLGIGWLAVLTVLSGQPALRSEEHTSELQSRPQLVCRLPLENKIKLLSSAHRKWTHRPREILNSYR